NLKNRVKEAYDISMNIYLQNRDKNKDTIKKMIKDALRPIRFNQGRGYFFIYSMNLKNILLPIAPQLEGKDFSNYQDIKGDLVVKNTAKLCKKYGSTFYTWYWRKPNSKVVVYKKIGFNMYFKPLNWFIGTGEYVEDFKKNLQEKILKEIQEIKYGKNNHFFTYSYDGKILTHARQNSNLVKEIIKVAKKGGGFLEYTVDQAIKKPETKISYISGIKEWHWAIGIGEYMSDIQKIIKQKQEELKQRFHDTLIKLTMVFAIIAILLVIMLVFITKKSQKVFLNYRNTILNETEKSKKQLLLIQHQNKLASMGEMLGNISHQWKQPLNTLGISIGKMILLEESGKLTKEIMLKSFERMERNIEYLSKTIDVFRDFFKPTQCVERFNLEDEIKNVVYIIQDSFEDKKIELSCVCEKEVYVKGDKKKLEQVFLNILNNAKDAIVSNEIQQGKVQIKSILKKNSVKITIQDNAKGIPSEIKDKIFEPYFTTKAQSKGTGVGLYMSKVIIEDKFQGSLTFQNKDNGALFTITIPQSLN
ncbi:MAG: GHKL domain-containing protein, partial [Epsilonproteobacteria bacterium]|nr:GHKL domain-containing protein [Campylobacterota bacterium]